MQRKRALPLRPVCPPPTTRVACAVRLSVTAAGALGFCPQEKVNPGRASQRCSLACHVQCFSEGTGVQNRCISCLWLRHLLRFVEDWRALCVSIMGHFQVERKTATALSLQRAMPECGAFAWGRPAVKCVIRCTAPGPRHPPLLEEVLCRLQTERGRYREEVRYTVVPGQ